MDGFKEMVKMIKTKDEIINMISARIGEDNSDEAIGLLEDITDTLNDYETRTADSTNWKEKYETNDKEWRDKYKERFMSGDSSKDEEIIDEEEKPKRYAFEDLFKEG